MVRFERGQGNDCAVTRRERLSCNVAVNPFERIGGGKRKSACQHLVQGDAQSVKIASCIDRPVHATGLLGRHIGRLPAITSGGAGAWHSCGRRDAIPNPVSRTLPASSTNAFEGLMSLCMRPRRWA